MTKTTVPAIEPFPGSSEKETWRFISPTTDLAQSFEKNFFSKNDEIVSKNFSTDAEIAPSQNFASLEIFERIS